MPADNERGSLTPETVLRFWFDELTPEQWFRGGDDLDAQILARFGDALERAKAGELDGWAATPDGALALLILLDQFSRNIHRGSADAFAQDEKALTVARSAIDAKFDKAQAPERRTFFYLPLEHSEDLADQERSVALFEALGDPIQADYARRHRDIIARFGRFPHRNPLLGRPSTAEEIAFLESWEDPF